MNNTYEISGPKAVVDIYHGALEKKLKAGKSREDAHRYALRCLHNAGWYRASNGWKRVHADLRGKIQLREAHRQPDGRFLIEDVEVFYPNAVKKDPRTGKPIVHTAADIRRYIANTNRAINRGARLSLVRGHPDPVVNKALDKQTPSYGAPVRFREKKGVPGRAVCDLVDVDASLVDELRQRRFPGLSAGFAEDAGGLGTRFGHVAVLGAESQALMNLPSLDVYSASNQLCFSADPTTFSYRRTFMTKEKAKEMADCYAAYGAALASFAAGEPGAEDKYKEARDKHHSKVRQFAAEEEMHGLPGGGYSEGEGGGSEETELPAEPLSEGGDAPPQESEFSAENFAALQTQVSSLTKRLSVVEKAKAALAGQVIRGSYEKKRDELLAAGHQFDAESADQMFASVPESKNPAEALKRLYAFLEKTPKRESLSAIGSVFGAEGAAPATGKHATLSEQEAGAMLDEIYQATGRSYSVEDLKLGDAFASIASLR